MRVVIDMQGVQSESRHRGIGRYSRSLVTHLLQLTAAQEHEFILLFNGQLSDILDELIASFRELVSRQNIEVFEPLKNVAWHDKDHHERAVRMEIIREAVVSELRPDVVLITSFFEGFYDDAVTSIGQFDDRILTAVIHYDLIPALNPTYLGSGNFQIFYERKLQQLPTADLLLSISESSQRDALKLFSLPEDHSVNVSAAAGPLFTRSCVGRAKELSALSRLGIRGHFVLFVPGGFDARKNFTRLLQAFSELSLDVRAGLQLVITGFESPQTEASLREIAASLGFGSHDLVLPGYISDDDLVTLYSCASLFVFPSLYEGFGLPVLEAMCCGAPVIAANSSSLPEVVGNPSALFDPNDTAAMTELMERSLGDQEFRQELCESAALQVEKFSWWRTAERTLTALERLFQVRPAITPHSETLRLLPERIVNTLSQEHCQVAVNEVAQCLANNFADRDSKPQFLLDVTELRLADSKTGIQRVVRSLLLTFLRRPPEGFSVGAIYYDKGRFRYATQFLANFAGLTPGDDEVVDFRSGDIYLSLDFTIRTAPRAEAFLKALSRRRVRICFVLYDLLPVLRPEWWPEGTSVRHEMWLRSLTAVADTVCCISKTVAQEFSEWLDELGLTSQQEKPAVQWFHLGGDIARSAPSSGMPVGYRQTTDAMANGQSFLMVGTLEPRKGHAQVLAGFELLWERDLSLNLVIVGKRGWMLEDFIARLESHRELGKRLFWLDAVSDECLEDLYRRSTCVLAASEGEGFGLPLVEAAQRGKPIIARSLPVFREVAGEGAFYFDGLLPRDLSESVLAWSALHCEGRAPSSAAIQSLTWDDSAQQLLDALALDHQIHDVCHSLEERVG